MNLILFHGDFFVVILLFLWACTDTDLKIYNGLFLLGCKGFICWVGIPRSGRFVVELTVRWEWKVVGGSRV